MADSYFDNIMGRRRPGQTPIDFLGGGGSPSGGVPKTPFNMLSGTWKPPAQPGFQMPTQPQTPTVTGTPWTPPDRPSDPLGTGQGFSYGNPGFDDPATKQYFDLLSQVVGRLTGAQDRTGDDQFTKILNDTITQFQQPVFNDENLAMLRTSANDELLRNRDASIQREQRRLGSSGLAPASPFVQSQLRDVDRSFETQQAANTRGVNDFALNTQLQRPGQVVGLAQTLQQLSERRRQEDLDNFAKALGLVSSGVSLTEGRLNQARQGDQGLNDITSILNAILGVSNTTNAQNQISQQNQQQWYDQFGRFLASYPYLGGT